MTFELIAAFLSIIEEVLPLLGVGTNNTALITTIINALKKLLPLIGNEAAVLYKTIKGIIQALTADPSTTSEQLAALREIDAQYDAAFEAAAAAVDPDAGVTS